MKSGQSRWLIVLTGLLAATAACSSSSDDDNTQPLTSSSPGSSLASPSPSRAFAATPTTRSGQASLHTQAGAVAFVRNFWNTYNQLIASLDVKKVYEISGSKCKYCNLLIENIKDLKEKNRHLLGGEVSVTGISSTKSEAFQEQKKYDVYLVTSTVNTSEQKVLSGDGKVVAVAPANVSKLVVFVYWVDGKWKIFDVADGEKK
jgi:hypothetical protein